MKKLALAAALGLTNGVMPSGMILAQEETPPTSAETLYAELAELSPEERQQLIEERACEEGTLQLVHTWRGDLARGHVRLFEARYPCLNVEWVDMGSQDAAERLFAEEATGRHLTDVVTLSVGDLGAILPLLAHYPTPVVEAILEPYAFTVDPENRWVPFYFTEFGISYNSNMLSEEEGPKDWWDLCNPEYSGTVSYDPPTLRWLLGVTEVIGSDRIEEWMQCIGENDPIIQRGHTQRLQLMLAGDHAIQGQNYLYLGMQMKDENPQVPFAPVWTAPVFGAPGVAIINRNTPHPYAAALFADWVLSDESQQYTSDQYRGALTLEHPFRPEDTEVFIINLSDPETDNRLLDMWEHYVMRGGR